MREIAKREKVILGIMTVVVFIGVVSLLIGKSNKKPVISAKLKSEELKILAGDVTLALTKDVLSGTEAYGIARAEAEWLHDPFFERKTYREMTASHETATSGAETVKNATFQYTGYLELGSRKIAIINGIEYVAGEMLDMPGYLLKAISPGKVVIEHTEENRVKLEVPIQD